MTEKKIPQEGSTSSKEENILSFKVAQMAQHTEFIEIEDFDVPCGRCKKNQATFALIYFGVPLDILGWQAYHLIASCAECINKFDTIQAPVTDITSLEDRRKKKQPESTEE